MTKHAAFLVLFTLAACAPAGTGDGKATAISDPMLRHLAESVDEFSLKSMVEHLTGAAPAPLSTGAVTIAERGGSQGRAYARQYIAETFAAFGLEVHEHPFTGASGHSGKNVEGILRGEEGGRHLYLTAHLDSVNNAGANDDASGIAAIMLSARALSQFKPRDTIHFVAFDQEETGLIGSYYYVREQVLPIHTQDSSKVIGDIQLDMVGHNAGGRQAVFADCDEAPDLMGALIASVKELKLGLNAETGCAARSDHVRFRDHGMQAVFVLDDFFHGLYPWYHEESDTIDKLDFQFLQEMTRAITASAAKLAFPEA